VVNEAQFFHVAITREYLVSNVLDTKVIFLSMRMPAFNSRYFELIKLDGSPLGSIKKGKLDNCYLYYKIRSLEPKASMVISSTVFLKRKEDAFFPKIKDLGQINEIARGNKVLSYLRDSSEYITRRVRKIAQRFLKKTNDLQEIEHQLMAFLTRNFRKVETHGEDPFLVFQRKYASPVDLAIAFILLNISMGVPARLVEGLLLNQAEKNLREHYWCEILSSKGWIPYDPWLNLEGMISLAHIPIKIENPFRRFPNIKIRYKVVKRTSRKAIRIIENGIKIRSFMDGAIITLERNVEKIVY